MVKAGQGAPLALLTSDASTEQGKQVVTSQERTDLLGLRRVVTLSTCCKVSSRPTTSWARLVLLSGLLMGAATIGEPYSRATSSACPFPEQGR